jgi:hypothetical protein
MSTISTIYDTMLADIATQLPNALKLWHAYRLEENGGPILLNGFGVRVGPAENTKRMVCPRVSIRRSMGVILTRKLYQRDMDADVKTSVEKDILEDQLLLIKHFESNPTVGGAMNVQFESDTGVSFVNTTDEEFMALETTFTVEYIENLS